MQGFISGGNYSSNPNNYLKDGYTTTKNEKSLYEVITNTANVFFTQNNTNKSMVPISIVLITVTLGIVIYVNRKKILNFIR